jgi:hypothetical protein
MPVVHPAGSDPKRLAGAAEPLSTTSGADPAFHVAIMLEEASTMEDLSVTFFVSEAKAQRLCAHRLR